ncbi:MAG: glycosyltransferase family 39 protein, partial [Candidatus Binatia bacterium]
SAPLAVLAARRWQVTPARRAAEPWQPAELAVLAAILGLAALTRLLWIDALPRIIFGDEPRVAMYLRNAYFGGAIPNFFSMGWNTWPVIGLSLQGLFVPFAGLDIAALRLSSALMGTLAVLTTFLVARELYGPRVALLAALLFAIGRTAIDFSRMGITHAQVLVLEPLALAFLWLALQRGRAAYYVLTGIAAGWCLHSYNAGQLVPPLIAGWLVICAVLQPRRIGTHWRGVLLIGVGFALTIFPYLYYFTDAFSFGPNWGQWTIMARNRQTMSRVREAWDAAGAAPAWDILRRQIATTWLGFGVLPGGGYTLGYRRGGMLDEVSAALFVVGLAIAIRRLRSGRNAFAAYWWLATVIAGGIMTIDPPSFVRMVGILPVLAILAALPLAWLIEAAPARSARGFVGLLLAAALAAGAAWDNWRTYFVELAAQRADPISEVARYLQGLPPDHRAVMLGAEHFLQLWGELFVLEFPNRTRDEPDPSQFLPLHEPITTPLALVLGPTQFSLMRQIQALYPEAQAVDVTADNSAVPMFRTVRLTPEQAQARTGLALRVEAPSATTTDGSPHDPFDAAWAPPGGATRLVWSGSVYWPTQRPMEIVLDAVRPTVLQVGTAAPLSADAGHPATALLTLPRGWQPVRIEEPAGGPRPLTISLREPSARTLTRWDFRPESAPGGLSATYRKPDGAELRAIDPQLNAFAVENRFMPGNEPFVRMPFTAEWRGALRVDAPGTYQFEALSSGPFSVRLDDAVLFEGAPDQPEQPVTGMAARELQPGLHPIAVDFDSRAAAHTTRRLFQLFWTPPGGERTLVPPEQFVPAP